VGVGISSAALSINCNPSGCRHDQVGLDGLGRVSSKTLVSDPDGATTVNTNYDSNGRVLKISNPYRSTSDSTYGWVTTAYDGLDRAQQITEQDGSVEATYYGAAVSAGGGQASQLCSGYGLGYPMLSVDEAGKKRQTWVDGFDRTIEADEPDSNNNLTVGTCYSYDLNNNLTQVVQGSETRTYSYDALSRLTTATNPESGTTNFYYTTSGGSLCSGNPVAVCQRTDARGITTTYLYDVLNRLTGKSYSDTTPAVSIAYDQTSLWGNTLTNPIGRKTSQSTAAPNYNAEIFGYDPMGRVTLNSKCSPANCGIGRYTLNYTYNFAGDLTSATDGVGVTLSYSYDAADRVTAVTSSLVDSQHPATLATVDPSVGYLPNGAVRAMTLGNGLTETGAFQSRLQPCRINVNSSGTFLASCSDAVPSGNVQDFGYGFNSGSTDNGNVASWSGTGTRSFSRTYTYDSLNRLATMSSPSDPSGCTGLSWTYDRWGNRTAQAVTGGSCGSWSAGYNSSNQITDTRFVYDAAGNLTNDGSHSYTYDAENRVTQVDGGSTATYVYDAEGRRVETTVAGAWTDYVRDLSGNVVTEANAGGPTRGYAYFGDRLLTQYQAPTATYFAFTDHLGSTRLLTTYSTTQSQNQQVYDSMDYLPFGEQIAGDSGTTHKFTGYERDPESNNDYAMARYYGSRLGRFMSPDPLGADVSNPQTLNRYAYVRNNPTTLTDPSGLCIVDSEDGFCTDWGFGIGYNPSRGCGGDAGPCKLGGLADNNGGVGNIPSPFGFRYSGCPFGEKSCTTQTFETWEAYANWSMWFASLPPNEAYVQFRKALPYVSATIDPNTVYTIQGQRRGLTTNYQIQSPDAASAVPLDIGMASANGAFDIGGGHGGNSSWYIGGWLNVLHVVDVSNAYLTGQLVGAEFHSDAFSPYGPFGPLHAIDWLASLISRGAWQEFHCSVVEGCQ